MKQQSSDITLKDAVAYFLVIALGIILIVHLALFWVYGGVFIHEFNKVILPIETAMSVIFFGFVIERFLNAANDKSRRFNKERW